MRPLMVSYQENLQTMAVEYAERGWPIVPMLEPVGGSAAGWIAAGVGPSTDRATAVAWWQEVPYGVGLVTGKLFEFLDVPGRLGPRVHAMCGRSVPVIGSGDDRWLVMVTPSSALKNARQALHWIDIRVRCDGAVVLAPPTRTADGDLFWHLHPHEAKWQPADSRLIARALLTPTTSNGASQ
ncbi:bifunctional DNA primase/polymerase [Fodinicola acaciae]|uniref:bifunctional DNA primase/polymerase n=1 Tax=Fodinicola acaciae TaxID=2681555 RepID=UPI0013D73021|nr:bifunctional DNA primase/polymerase [Fodinicola acaciae]